MKIKLHTQMLGWSKEWKNLSFYISFGFLFIAVSTVTIADTVTLSSASYQVNEDNGPGIASVTFNPTCGFGECYDAVRINYVTVVGTASNTSDYTPVSGTVTWTDASSLSQTISIPITADNEVEPDEVFTLRIENCQAIFFDGDGGPDDVFPCSSAGISVVSPSNATVTIINDDDPGIVTLDSVSLNINEIAGNAVISASRTGSTQGPASVDFSTVNGSAVAGEDFTAVSGTLSWADGEGGSKSITVPILDDNTIESTETFNLNLSNPVGGIVIQQNSAAIQINDDDIAGSVSFDNSVYTVNETDGAVLVTASRVGGLTNAVSVEFATNDGDAVAGSDYNSVSGVLSWAAGEGGSKTISIPIISDLETEVSENFTISLTNPTNGLNLGLSNASITIIEGSNSTTSQLTFSALTYSVTEGRQVNIIINRNGTSGGAISVDYRTIDGSAVAGADYQEQSGTISWLADDFAPKTITINTLINPKLAGKESKTFTVELFNPTGDVELDEAVSQASVTINENTAVLGGIPDLTPNQKALADTLDSACSGANASSEFQQLCNDLLTSDNPQQILESIIPEQVASQGTAAIEFGFLQLNFLHGRIVSLRNRNNNEQFNILGFNMNVNGDQVPLGKLSQFASNALGGAASGDEDSIHDSPLSFFLKGQINIGDREGTDRVKGYDIDTKGITFGADYRFNDELVMGLALGYGHTHNDFNNFQGEMSTESGDISLYGSYFLPQDFYVDWIFSYTINSYEMERRIRYPGLDTKAYSDPYGDQYGVSFGFGKDFYINSFFISPYARVEYLDTSIDSYSERAEGGVALAFNEQSLDSVMTTLGGQLSYAISMPWGVLTPGARAEYVHQFKDNSREIQARFIGAPTGTGQFSIATDSPDRNYFNLGASIGATFAGGRSAFFRYGSRVGQDRVSNHTLELGVRLPF